MVMIRVRSLGNLVIVVVPNEVILAHIFPGSFYGVQPVYKEGTYIELSPAQARTLGLEEEAELAEQFQEQMNLPFSRGR